MITVPVKVVDGTREPDTDAVKWTLIEDQGSTMVIEVFEPALPTEIQENNKASLLLKARQALNANKSYLQADPSNAEALDQIDALTRQVNALIKIIVASDLLDDESGT